MFSSHHPLRDVGFDEDVERRFREFSPDSGSDRGSGPSTSDLAPARIIFANRELYRVVSARGEQIARPAGRLRRAELPVVGDWVVVTGEPPTIHGLLARRTVLSRQVAGEQVREQVVAANVDTVFLVMGLDGDFNLRRLERFAVMAAESGAEVVVVLTKADLADDPITASMDVRLSVPGTPVVVVSALEHQGLEALEAYLVAGRTVTLIGSSGVGKSTLVNWLSGTELVRTGAVRAGDDRGRHTTTHRQLVRLPGGSLLIDNPGVREIQLWADEEALAAAFDDVDRLARGCRFSDCGHHDEPGCAVIAAIDGGQLDAERLAHWQGLQRELRHVERRRDVAARRRDERATGKLHKRMQNAKRSRQRR